MTPLFSNIGTARKEIPVVIIVIVVTTILLVILVIDTEISVIIVEIFGDSVTHDLLSC